MKAKIVLISLILPLALSLIPQGNMLANKYKGCGFNTNNYPETITVKSAGASKPETRQPKCKHAGSLDAGLSFPVGDSLYLFAGNDTSVCLSGFYIDIYGEAQNFHYTSWATTGDGFFDEAINLNTQYFPGTQDMANGLANLYLVGICVEPSYLCIIDSVKITFVEAPACFAGFDSFICEDDVFMPDAIANSYADVLWNTLGDGTFDDVNILNPTYFHGEGDVNNGHVILELTAFPMEPCMLPDINQMTLYITPKREVDAGNDTIICEGQSIQLNAGITNNGGIYWSSDGDGTFSCFVISDPVYFPGPQDILNGGCTLNAIALPAFPCEPELGDDILIEIVSQAVVSIGSDITICENETVSCDASVDNYESLQWIALGGNGYFEDSFSPSTIYHPGEHEKNTGILYVLLMVNSIDPCTSAVNAYFKVELVNQAFVTAGPDQMLCSNDTAILYGFGENYTGVSWETFGDGTFAGDQQLFRKYIPGPLDLQSGATAIYVCATSNAPCNLPVCDTVMLVYQDQVFIDAGNDATICHEHQLTGEAGNYVNLQWHTSGDGTFENPNALNSLYYAGAGDIENLSVKLTLIAEPYFPCEATLSDEIQLIIDRPVLLSGSSMDQDILLGESVSLNMEVNSLRETSYQWYHNGEEMAGQYYPQLTLNSCQPDDAGRYFCKYWNNCFTFYSDTSLISVLVPATQNINFSSGWNAVSTYILPDNTNIEVLLSPVIDQIVILYGNDGIFYPDQEVQTFSNWNSNMGYILKTTSADNLNIQGFIKYPIPEIILMPGWSILPVGQQCVVTPETLLGNYPQIVAVKEVGGLRVYWPEKNIYTLENIIPGKAYEVFNASDTEVSFTFPGCGD
jgi:hypothetical protein